MAPITTTTNAPAKKAVAPPPAKKKKTSKNTSRSNSPVPDEENTEENEETSRQKGPNFSVEEDILLCKAWVDSTQNSIKGNNQKAYEYWQSVYERYSALEIKSTTVPPD